MGEIKELYAKLMTLAYSIEDKLKEDVDCKKESKEWDKVLNKLQNFNPPSDTII